MNRLLCLLALVSFASCEYFWPAAATCTDGRINGLETDVDCGGGSCTPCAADRLCLADADCASTGCVRNRCVGTSCVDGLLNGDETDLDCGGSCAPCAASKACLVPTDCASGSCTGAVCAGASCTDELRNGAETDVDCGGGACPTCANGEQCDRNSDCASSLCVDGACTTPGAGGGGGGSGGGAGGGSGGGGGGGGSVDAGAQDAGTPPIDCGSGLTECSMACVNTDTDPGNCGQCDLICPPSQLCSQGVCATACTGSSTDCGGFCVDTDSNPLNCGGCNQPCNSTQICVSGTCQSACTPGTTACGNQCVSLSRDALNCGFCNLPCPSGSNCVNSQCEVACPAGLSACGPGCVNKDTDPNNCGHCGNMCPWPPGAFASCIGGVCGMALCQPQFGDCNGDPLDGCETDLGFDTDCKACGHQCAVNQFCGLGGCCLTTLPSGTYQATCTGCTACEGVLHCTCNTMAMTPNDTTISLQPPCGPGYINCNGVLKCGSC